MNEDFKKAYKALSLNDKRNAISNELMLIGNLISGLANKYGINNICPVKNYDSAKDTHLTESEMLDFFYEDIYHIEKEFITLASLIEKQMPKEEDY